MTVRYIYFSINQIYFLDPDQFDQAAKTIIRNNVIPYSQAECDRASLTAANRGLIPPCLDHPPGRWDEIFESLNVVP